MANTPDEKLGTPGVEPTDGTDDKAAARSSDRTPSAATPSDNLEGPTADQLAQLAAAEELAEIHATIRRRGFEPSANEEHNAALAAMDETKEELQEGEFWRAEPNLGPLGRF